MNKEIIKQKHLVSLAIISISFLTFLASCSHLLESPPILKQVEYERMIAGSFEADFIGTDVCSGKCHKKYLHDLQRSVHGEQVDYKGLPRVNCESCHGAGSLTIKDEKPTDGGLTHKSLIDIAQLPPQAKSLICLKCHTANSTFILHDWNAGIHSGNEITCVDCHHLHKGPQQKVAIEDLPDLCFQCHKEIKAEFGLSSHHPVPEKKIFCIDCHNPMGSTGRKLVRYQSIKELCTQCHGEKKGPFVYEHADLTEDCENCHRPHGSPNNNLLIVNEPFLCFQCHNGHRDSRRDMISNETMKRAFYTRCTDCHSMIHGTDVPSKGGKGTFIQ